MTFRPLVARLALAALLAGPAVARAQAQACVNDAPNPYEALGRWGSLPDGRAWGPTAGIAIAPNGRIWALDRCGGRSCVDNPVAPVVELSADGQPLRTIGAGLMTFPHGLTIDRKGDIWVTDSQAQDGVGMQVLKLSPEGKVLLRLGVAGTFEGDGALDQPTSVAIARNGDIYVAEGHNPNYRRSQVVRYAANGRRLGVIGSKGNAPGEIYGPHALAFDSRGRLFVADRNNNRISIFDAKGRFVTAWSQFGRPSGLYIDARDTLYVADSESNDGTGYGSNPGCRPGIRVGSARTGKVSAFLPAEPAVQGQGNPAAEGVVAGRDGAIYGAINGTRGLRKYRPR